MSSQRSRLLLVCILGIITGIVAIIYGFELVSVPLVREHHELSWVLGGVALVICGAACLLFGARKARARSDVSPPR